MLLRRPSRLLFAIAAAWMLLAEALIAIAVAPTWLVSWWEWHLLITLAVLVVAWAVEAEYRRPSSTLGPFTNLYLEHTLGRVDSDYAAALDELVAARALGKATDAHADELGERLGLSGEERLVLQRAAGEIDRVDRLFRPYVPAQLARELAVDPVRARLGGEEREVSVLFADLEGFTAFSEHASPAAVITMLNEYWGLIVPEVLGREDGLIERFSGDAIMVMFNATGDQPDHAVRAARAALALQRAGATLSAQHPDWPRFRVGVNTGAAVVGNVGTADQRSFAAIGEATNHAARLQAAAAPGEIVVGEATPERWRESPSSSRSRRFASRASSSRSWHTGSSPLPGAAQCDAGREGRLTRASLNTTCRARIHRTQPARSPQRSRRRRRSRRSR